MKRMMVVGLLFAWSTLSFAQYEDHEKQWRMIPEITVVRYLPGNEFSLYGSPVETYQYSGFGGALSARFLNRNIPGLALTVSGGAVSFSKPQVGYTMPMVIPAGMSAASTLAGDERLGDFFVCPLSIGVQGILPFDGFDKFRAFAGIEASGYFIDGNVAPHAQTRFGYSAVGGFGIGIVDLGVRYSQFADMRNMGVFIGFCLKPFEF